MNVKRLIPGLLCCAFASAGVAATATCQPVIAQAWVRAPPPGASTLAAYATVRNPCAAGVAIAGVSGADFGMAMIHQTSVENGMSRMRVLGPLAIPAKGEAVLAPGGSHIMLMQAKRQFREGDRIRLSFRLADGRELVADFVVRRE